MLTDDAVEKIIGGFGKYQTWILFLVTVGRYPTDFQLTNVVFILPNVEYDCLDTTLNETNYCPCDNPNYDTSTIVNSVTSTWNLICNRTQYASLAQSMLQIGILAGSILYGYLSDRYGRKLSILLALISNVCFVAASGLSPYFWVFMIFRFLIGSSVGGTMLCCYTLFVELSGKSFRPYLTALTEISYVSACIFLPMIAYFVREWRYLQMVTSVPWVFIILYCWLLPESPRWLITMGRKKEAVEVLTKIAKWNNMETKYISVIVEKIEEKSQENKNKKNASYLDLFRTPKLRIYTIIIAWVWFCCGHTYFGINQYIGRLQGNFYLNIILSGFCHLPAMVLNVLATLYLQRKVGVMASFSIAAFSLLVFIFLPNGADSWSLAFAIFGQMGAYMAFTQIYLYTSEVFPTIVRNSAMGFASMCARVGAFSAPFVVNIGIEWISILVFSGVALAAAIVCLFLPATKDTVLLNTIQQTEDAKGQKNSSSKH